MRSARTVLTILTLSCWLGAWPTPADAQTRPALGVPPAGSGASAALGAVILPVTSLQPGSRPVRLLSVDEAVTLALEQNLDLRVQRLNPLIQDMSIAQARSVYTPTLSSTLQGNNRNTPSQNIFESGARKVTDRLLSDSVNVLQAVPWAGGQYSVNWLNSHFSTNSIFTSFDPVLRSNFNVNYIQPLLRNLKIDGPRQAIAITRANREISDIQLRSTVVQTQRAVRNAYWELVGAQSLLDVQRQSLELAEESLRNNRRRVEIGTIAAIDIVEAELEVARNDEAVIIAEAQVDRAEDRLRTLIFDPDAPDFWAIRIEPSDSPVLQAREIDVDTAVRNALDNRTDLHTLDKNIQNTDTDIRYYGNQRLPDVNLQVNYALSGVGGTRLLRGSGFPPPIIGQEETSFGSVLGDIFSNDFPNWTVGINVSYPLGTSSAEANLERARLQRTQAEVTRRSLEVRIATQVRDASRSVRMNLQRVQATRAARQLAERRLEAELRRDEVGLSTSFLVIQAQRDLASARNNEQNAILDYTRSLVDFDAVQEIPLGGAF